MALMISPWTQQVPGPWARQGAVFHPIAGDRLDALPRGRQECGWCHATPAACRRTRRSRRAKRYLASTAVRNPILPFGYLFGLFGEGFLPSGALGEPQKQPGGLPPHLSASVQHVPPVYVLQQHTVPAILRADVFGGSAACTAAQIGSRAATIGIVCTLD
jgi:hypothetical protein